MASGASSARTVAEIGAARARRDGGHQRPRPVGAGRGDRQGHAAGHRARQAQIDVVERPLLPAAAIVDHDRSALEADLDEAEPVEPQRIEAIEPAEQGREAALRGLPRRRVGRGRQRQRRTDDAARQRGRTRNHGRRRSIGPGHHGHLAVRLDAHGHASADQAQPLRPDAAGQQGDAGNAKLGLGSDGNDRAVAIAHHDVAQPQCRVAFLGALDLGAADLNMMAPAEPILDGGNQPRRDHVDGERAACQPPPQARGADDDERGGHGRAERQLADRRAPSCQKMMDRGVLTRRARARGRNREGRNGAPMQMQRRPRAPHGSGPD